MKVYSLLVCALLILSCGSSNNKSETAKAKVAANPVNYANTITQDELREMLYTYASDEFEGRETGEPGQKMAANYLKEQYLEMGIPSPISEENYFQPVALEKQKIADVELTLNNDKLTSFDDFLVLGNPQSQMFEIAEIVYVGFGIDAENYSDYKNINVKDKIVLVKAGEPKDANGNFITSGTKTDTDWSSGRASIRSKRDAALKNGAKAILHYSEDLLSVYGPYYQKLAASGRVGRMALKSKETEIINILVGDKFVESFFPEIKTSVIHENIKVDLTSKINAQSEKVDSENVVAFLKGTEKPNEILVISAHLDHEGIKNGEVYNGADDDGSGTVAVLEIAEAFKKAANDGYAPKRSILFLHVTGEERGLLGSRHYSDNDPLFPLENTVANLNIDMVGRTDPKRDGDRNYIYLIGSDKLSTELHNISEEINSKYTNITLDYKYNDDNDPNRFYYRSDHYNFAKNNIPVIFYFNGTHDDYHQPSDTPDKIEYDLLENRTRLIFHTAWELANRDERIVVDKAKIVSAD
ncbi:MAG: M28 family metallopeptidase [Bacteroidota bacterium]